MMSKEQCPILSFFYGHKNMNEGRMIALSQVRRHSISRHKDVKRHTGSTHVCSERM
jgi:hypothetical protein